MRKECQNRCRAIHWILVRRKNQKLISLHSLFNLKSINNYADPIPIPIPNSEYISAIIFDINGAQISGAMPMSMCLLLLLRA